jgi:hypothetical protein
MPTGDPRRVPAQVSEMTRSTTATNVAGTNTSLMIVAGSYTARNIHPNGERTGPAWISFRSAAQQGSNHPARRLVFFECQLVAAIDRV